MKTALLVKLEQTKYDTAKECCGEEYGNAIKLLRSFIAGMRYSGPNQDADELETALESWLKEKQDEEEKSWKEFRPLLGQD